MVRICNHDKKIRQTDHFKCEIQVETYYKGYIDGADDITLFQSWARGIRVKVKHLGLGVC